MCAKHNRRKEGIEMEYLIKNIAKWWENLDEDNLCPNVTSCIIHAPNPNVCKIDINTGKRRTTNSSGGCLIKIG